MLLNPMPQSVRRTADERPGVRPWLRRALLPLLALAIAGCASSNPPAPDAPKIPEPLRAPQAGERAGVETLGAADKQAPQAQAAGEQQPRAEKTPQAPGDDINIIRPGDAPVELSGEPTSLNVDQLPLPAFINEVFGNILGLDFQIAPDLRKRNDRVTLRISEPQPPEAIFRAANSVLASYGVGIAREGELLRFVRADKADADAGPPLLVTGRALPSVPESNRPVFQLVPLEVISNVSARGWIQKAFANTDLEVSGSPTRTALLLRGPADVVRQAARATRLFDQPHMRGRHGLRLNPRFRDPEAMAADLVELLKAEGYAAGQSTTAKSVIVLPMPGVGAIFVFATSERVLQHVRDWSRELDQPARTSTDGKGIFYYKVQNTSATALARVVSRVLSGGGGSQGKRADGSRGNSADSGNRESTSGGAGAASSRGGFAAQGLVVDEVGNALICNGDPETWARLRPLIDRMDRPTPQVLVEVAVVEVTLNDQRDLGIEGLLQDIDLGGDLTAQLSTQGGLGLGGSGLTATLNDPGDGQLVLNAFASSERVTILSRPHLMVRSGQEASIDVGTEVPVITSQASSAEFQQDGESAILQEVQFRETGVILEVKPIVRGGQTVDIEVRQEVSEAQPTQTSDINSPSIFRRAVDTKLTLRDGTPVLMGGLISSDRSDGTSGVPLLKDIPGVGRLFRTDSESTSRTELMVLMTPYILRTHDEAREITRAFERALSRDEEPGRGGQSMQTGGRDGQSEGRQSQDQSP